MTTSNLISNLGFNPDSTHTSGGYKYAELPTQSLIHKIESELPLVANDFADNLFSEVYFDKSHLLINRYIIRFINLIHKIFKISL